MLLWWIAALGAAAGGFALVVLAVKVRSLRRRIDQLNQKYWELRYEYTQLRADVARLDPDAPKEEPPDPRGGDVGFVPLSSLKK
jgi:hypothetical protein